MWNLLAAAIGPLTVEQYVFSSEALFRYAIIVNMHHDVLSMCFNDTIFSAVLALLFNMQNVERQDVGEYIF